MCAANKTDEPILNVLRKATILSSTTDEQYSAATLAKVSSLEQSLAHQNTASALRNLAFHQGGKGGQQQPAKLSSGPTRGGTRGRSPKAQTLLPAVSDHDGSLRQTSGFSGKKS